MSKTHTFAIADEENCRLDIGESRLFANCGLKKQGKRKKRERKRKGDREKGSRQKRKKNERKRGEKNRCLRTLAM